jgi:hypothetical protein
MPKIKSTQPPKQSTDELFQEHQPRSIHTINLQPDPPDLPTPKSEADKSSLLNSLDPILNLVGATLRSINYHPSQSNSAMSISIIASTHSANFVKSLLHHHPNQHQPKPEPQDVTF